jgi:hypothetical protein
MNTSVLTRGNITGQRSFQTGVISMLALFVLMQSLFSNDELTRLILATISDAYIQVTSFVAATLFIFYGLEKLAGIDAEKMLAKATPNTQVVLAALLGALPGCGGAIIVVTQYATGRLSFGAVLSVLTATMGDAAFLLIASEPVTGMFMMGLGFSVGSVTGIIVNAIHGPDFMRPDKPFTSAIPSVDRPSTGGWLNRIWLILFLPGLAFGIMAAFQIDIDGLLGSVFWPEPSLTIGAVGGVLSVAMFLVPKILKTSPHLGPQHGQPHNSVMGELSRKVIGDTNFVTAWVILAFLSFELCVYVFSIDLVSAFEGYRLLIPMIAVLIGFIPGCGPQVLVTSLYLTGVVPLSAQIGNTISNDGDALFPAIAIAPKAAVLATLYSAIPALLLSYGWMGFVEGF